MPADARTSARTDTIEIRRLVEHPLLLPDASYATRKLFDRGLPAGGRATEHPGRKRGRARAARARGRGPRHRDHSVDPADRPQSGPHHAGDAPLRTVAHRARGPVGQAARAARLRRRLLGAACRAYTRGVPALAAAAIRARGYEAPSPAEIERVRATCAPSLAAVATPAQDPAELAGEPGSSSPAPAAAPARVPATSPSQAKL